MAMQHAARATLLACSLCAAVAAFANEPETKPPVRPSDEAIARAIENLGSSSQKVADAATEALIGFGRPALPTLDLAGKGEEEPRASRAKRIATEIRDSLRIVQDAMSRPIAGGTVEVAHTVSGRGREKDREIKQTVVPDSQGNIYLKFPPRSSSCVATLRHPEYGISLVKIKESPNPPTIRFPVVHLQSPEAVGALRGRVVGPDGKPIAGALIDHFRLREGDNDHFHSIKEGAALTDAAGQFLFYRAYVGEYGRELAKAVRPGSTYSFSVRVPHDPALFPCAMKHGNDSSVEVKLERAVRFHTLRFEKPTGGFLSERELRGISFSYTKTDEGLKVQLDPSWAVRGAKLLTGIYTARHGDDKYEPVAVTADSPKELVFRLLKAEDDKAAR